MKSFVIGKEEKKIGRIAIEIEIGIEIVVRFYIIFLEILHNLIY